VTNSDEDGRLDLEDRARARAPSASRSWLGLVSTEVISGVSQRLSSRRARRARTGAPRTRRASFDKRREREAAVSIDQRTLGIGDQQTNIRVHDLTVNDVASRSTNITVTVQREHW